MSEALLSLNGVSIRRGSSLVFKDLNFELMGGQIVLLNDKNGAGKSTMLEATAGLLPLENGEIFHHGELILDASGRSKRPSTAFGLTLQSDGCVGSQRLEEHLSLIHI